MLLALPAWIAGRPFVDLLLLYANQRILPFPALTHGATNLYQWLSDNHFALWFVPGLVLAAIAAGGLVWVLWRPFPSGLSDEGIVQGTMVSLILMPFVLPTMHERYSYSADVLSVAYAFWFARGWWIALLVQIASFFTYLPYLFNQEPVPRPVLAVLMAVALLVSLRCLWRLGRDDSGIAASRSASHGQTI